MSPITTTPVALKGNTVLLCKHCGCELSLTMMLKHLPLQHKITVKQPQDVLEHADLPQAA